MDWLQWLSSLACDPLFEQHPISPSLFEHAEQLAADVSIKNLPALADSLNLSVKELRHIIYRILTSQTIGSVTIPSPPTRRSASSGQIPGNEKRSLEARLLEHAFLREHFMPQVIEFIRHLPTVDLSLLATGAHLEKQYYRTLNSQSMKTLEKQHYFSVVAKRAAASSNTSTVAPEHNIVEYFICAGGGSTAAAAAGNAALDSRLRLILGEVLYTLCKHQSSPSSSERGPVNSNSLLFRCDSLCIKTGDMLCILIDTAIVTIEEVTTALLHLPHGLWHACRLAVNFPLLFEKILAQIFRILDAIAVQNKLNSSASTPPLWSLVVFKVLKLQPAYLGQLLEQSLAKRSSLRDVFLLAEARCCDLMLMPTNSRSQKFRHFDSAGQFVLSLLQMLLAGVVTHENNGRNLAKISNSAARRPAATAAGTNSHVSKWVALHWRDQYRLFDSSFQQLRSMLTCYLAACVHHLENSKDDESAVLRISPDLMTTYAAASCVYTLKWSDDEARLLLRLITHRISSFSHATAQKHVIYGLAIVLLGANEKVFSNEEADGGMTTLKSWFRWLLSKSKETSKNEQVFSQQNFADILLLFGTNFHSGQMETLNDLVQKILGFRLSSQIITSSAHAARMARAFADEIFTDSVLAQHSARVWPTRQLSLTSTSSSGAAAAGIVPAHCILQLVQTGVFNRVPYIHGGGGFELKKWILQQIQFCTAPVHTVMIELIEAYNQQCIFPSTAKNLASRKNSFQDGGGAGKSNSTTTTSQFVKFSESEICEIFTTTKIFKNQEEEIDDDDRNYTALMLLQSSSANNDEKMLNFYDFDPNDDACVVPRILLLYAVLNFNDRSTQWLWATIKAGGKLPSPPLLTRKISATPYSPILLQNLPIKLLLSRMEVRRNDLYACVYAKLMRYVLQQLPHLCQVEDFLDEQQFFVEESIADSMQVEILRDRLEIFIDADNENESNLTEICEILHKLSLLRPAQLVFMQSNFLRILQILTTIPLKNQNSAENDKIEQFTKLILVKLNKICPARLWCDLTSLYLGQSGGGSRRTIHFEKLCDEPLLIFQAFLSTDESVLKTESCCSSLMVVLIEFSLRIFKCCLAAQQVQLATHLLQTCYEKFQFAQENSAQQQKNQKLAVTANNGEWPPSTGAQMLELTQKYTTKKLDAYLKLQASAAVQCLLEFCQQIFSFTKNQRILNVICNHLHQEFIHDAYVGKLVAFQGFRLELLPILVERVPSFHICIDFIPELLGQWQLHKKVFAYHLLAHLACKYRVQKAMNVAHMALDVANTMLVVCDSEERQRVFTSIAPCLIVLARVFVPLRQNAMELLQQLARMEQSMLAKQRSGSVVAKNRRSQQRTYEEDVEDEEIFISNEQLLSRTGLNNKSLRKKTSKFDGGAVLQPLAQIIVRLSVNSDVENACK